MITRLCRPGPDRVLKFRTRFNEVAAVFARGPVRSFKTRTAPRSAHTHTTKNRTQNTAAADRSPTVIFREKERYEEELFHLDALVMMPSYVCMVDELVVICSRFADHAAVAPCICCMCNVQRVESVRRHQLLKISDVIDISD